MQIAATRGALPMRKARALLLLLIVGGAAIGGSAKQQAGGKQLGGRYLLLVNTAIASLLDASQLRQFDKSPYDGLAVAFLHAYDTSPVPSSPQMKNKIENWKQFTGKDIWPWVYVNRMIAIDPKEKDPYSNDAYFRKFRGADLEDKSGARTDFLKNWSNSLRAARETNAPGVLLDLEFYNFYGAYDIGELARQIAKTPEETAVLLKQLGARLAVAAAAEYPEATLWFPYTGFTRAGFKTIDNQPYYPSPTYIAIGLLDEIQKKHFQLRVLSGGEGALGYCHENLDEFRRVIQDRAEKLNPQLRKYQGALELAGTMTLWSEAARKKDWMKEGDCGTSPVPTIEAFEPYLELLLKSYRYNWIYASSNGDYQAFLPQSAPRFDAVIRRAQQAGQGHPHN